MAETIKIFSIVMNNFTNDARVLKEVQSLSHMGNYVKVVAMHDGNIHLPENEITEGIKIQRIKLFSKNWPKKKLFQLIKYMEFFLKAFFVLREANIVHCNDLEPLPIAIAAKMVSFGRIKVVYDAHELETEQIENMNPLFHLLLTKLESFFVRFADRMITVSEGIADEYVRRYSLVRPVVIMNAPHYAEIQKKNLFREKLGIAQGQKIFLYQGGLMPGRGIDLMINTFKREHRDDIALVIMGYGPMEKYVRTVAMSMNNVFFHEAVSPGELLRFTASADFGFCVTENNCLNNYYCLPNKFFEYAMIGLPMIINDLYELKKMNEAYSVGVSLERFDVDACIAAIDKILKEDYPLFSGNAKRMARENAWEVQERKLLHLYKEIS